MKIYNINSQEDAEKVVDRFWEIAIKNPRLVELIQKALKDPDLERQDMICLGFKFGALFVLNEFGAGHLKEANYG